MRRRLVFNWRYLVGQAPWDTGVSPPELMSYIDDHPPGRAIDLGCGTGTNVLTLAQNGWDVTGVDFSRLAIRRARRRIARSGFVADLRVRDVSDLAGVGQPFDLALDIGCFHSLSPAKQEQYMEQLKGLVRPGGSYLLYAFLRDDTSDLPGLTDETSLKSRLEGAFELVDAQAGFFNDHPSGWFTFTRR